MEEKKYDLFTCIVCGLIGFCLFLPTMFLVNYYSHPHLARSSSEPIVLPPSESVGEQSSNAVDQDIGASIAVPVDTKLFVINDIGRIAAITDDYVVLIFDESSDSPFTVNVPIGKFQMVEPISDELRFIATKFDFSNFDEEISFQQNIDAYLNYAFVSTAINPVY